MLSKLEIAAALGVGVWILSKGSKAPAKGGPVKSADDKLLSRANQSRAREWEPILMYDLGIPEAQALAATRWFGIESGGNPRAVSSEGERGLAQITHTSAITEGALSQAEWDALGDPDKSSSPGFGKVQDDARLAEKVIAWCYRRASSHIHGAPPIDPIEQIWYAKLYHQSPVDVRDAKLSGDAIADAHRLEHEWAADPKKLHYLHAANVVAWGSVLPPALTVAEK